MSVYIGLAGRAALRPVVDPMIVIASNMNDLAPLAFAVMLDGGYFLLFVIALLMRCHPAARQAAHKLLRFLAWAGVVLIFVVAIMLIPVCIEAGNSSPMMLEVPTVLLAGIVAGTWREVRGRPDKRPASDARERPRSPEDR